MSILESASLCVDLVKHHTSFQSQDVDETSAYAAALIAEHEFVTAGEEFQANINHSQCGHVCFAHMHFGSTVLIDPGRVHDFTLIHMPLQGLSRLHHVGGETLLNPKIGGVIGATSPFHIEWESSCSQLIVLIAREKLEQACRALWGASYNQPLVLAPDMDMDSVGGRGWRQLVGYALSNLPILGGAGARIARGHLNDIMIAHLLLNQAHNYSHIDWRTERGQVAPRSIKVAEQYIEDNLAEPLTLFDIAEHVGVSVRTLLRNFRDYRRRTPMDLLRDQRLERVHLELQSHIPTSVSDVAYQWGFTHLGRFAKLYKERYGQTPSQTLTGR